MLLVRDVGLDAVSLAGLADLQRKIDSLADYESRVERAREEWTRKTSAAAGKQLFDLVRKTLSRMCGDLVRCMYCEDSVADEIEHVLPKSFFPCSTFVWSNFGYACGPCNGFKNNKYGVVVGAGIVSFSRRRNDHVVPPPGGLSAFIDPRLEDATGFLDLDLGGTTPEGRVFEGTFEFLVKQDLNAIDALRADFTIRTLDLNGDLLRASRANAFGGYVARLREYAREKRGGADRDRLEALKRDILITPHPTVFVEMLRQRASLPAIRECLDACPEILSWGR
jgi:hypothetical protein